MLVNATLLRIDDPPPAGAGPAVAIRCAMGTPTTSETTSATAMGLHPVAMLYLPMASLPPGGAPVAGQLVTAALDGCPPATFTVAYAVDRVGDVLTHVQVFLVEA